MLAKINETERKIVELIIKERSQTHSTIDAIDIISRLQEISDKAGIIMDSLEKS